jgi:hypothetical protein
VGLTKPQALSLLNALMDVSDKPDKKVRPPRLKSVLNPNSKYYDDSPKLTRDLSLLFFNHQQGYKRLRHNRITKDDRQWVFLVSIKKAIVKITGAKKQPFMIFARKLFIQAEKISRRRSLYLPFVISRLPELIDITADSLDSVVLTKEARVWRAYRRRRMAITGFGLQKKLEPGSDDHIYSGEIADILSRYKVPVKIFMNIQFAAFNAVGTFPKLKDLTTRKAIDRLEQGMVRLTKESGSEEDKEYWDEVERETSRKSKRKTNR